MGIITQCPSNEGVMVNCSLHATCQDASKVEVVEAVEAETLL